METMNDAVFRNHLPAFIKQMRGHHKPLLLTHPQGSKSYEKTAYLMSSVKDVKQLTRTISMALA